VTIKNRVKKRVFIGGKISLPARRALGWRGMSVLGEAMKITNTSRFLGHPLPTLGRGNSAFRNCLTSFYFGIFMQTAEETVIPPLP
jgi:hypothetical protein